jgi:hypothetical protein
MIKKEIDLIPIPKVSNDLFIYIYYIPAIKG